MLKFFEDLRKSWFPIKVSSLDEFIENVNKGSYELVAIQVQTAILKDYSLSHRLDIRASYGGERAREVKCVLPFYTKRIGKAAGIDLMLYAERIMNSIEKGSCREDVDVIIVDREGRAMNKTQFDELHNDAIVHGVPVS